MKNLTCLLVTKLALFLFFLFLIASPLRSLAQCGAIANYKPTVSSRTICSGNYVYVYATGLPVSKWIYRDNNTGAWNVYSSSSDNISFYMSSTVPSFRTFKVIISTNNCISDTSDGIDVAVVPITYGNNNLIKLSASNYSPCGGSTVKLSLMNQGVQTSQWLYRDNGGNWSVYTNSNSTSMSIAMPYVTTSTIRDYRVITLNNNSCQQDSSDIVTLKINPTIAGNNNNVKPFLTQQSICGGTSVQVQVEWPLDFGNWIYKDANGNAWQSMTSSSNYGYDYNTTVANSTLRSYKVILVNPTNCTADSSNEATIQINASMRRNIPDILPKITTTNPTVCAGNSQSFQLSGYNSVSWYYRDSVNGSWVNFGSGSNSSASSKSNNVKDIQREVRVVLNNSSFSCSYDTSASVFYTIKANTYGNTTMSFPYVSTTDWCAGSQVIVYLNNGLTVNNWLYRNNNLGSWINGGSGSTYYDYNTTISSNTQRSYKAVVSNTALCRIDTTPEVQVNIKVPTPGGNIAITPILDKPAYCASTTVSGNVSINSSYLVSKWIYRDNNTGLWLDLPSQTSTYFYDYYTSTITSSTKRSYKVLLKNLETFRIDTSDEVVVTINPLSRGNVNVTPTSTQSAICVQSGFPISVVLPANYTVYTWIGRELSTSGWSNLGYSSTSFSDNVNSINPSKSYRVILLNSELCKYDSSNIFTAPIKQRIGRNNNGIIPTSNLTSICSGSSLSLTTSLLSGNSVSKWMYSDNGVDWKSISSSSTNYNESGNNTKVLNIVNRNYKVVINDNTNCFVDTSAMVMVAISPLLNGITSSITPVISSNLVCAGSTISPYLNNYSGTVQKWVYRDNKGPWTELNSSTNSTYLYDYNSYVSSNTNRDYRTYLVRTGTCYIDTTQVLSTQIKVYTNGNASALLPATSAVSACSGSSFNVSLSNYSGTIHKWIYRQNHTGEWRDFLNSNSSNIFSETNTNVINSTIRNYRAIILTTGCSYDTSGTVSVQLNPIGYGYATSVALNSNSGVYCSGSNIPMNVITNTMPANTSVKKWMYMDNQSGQWNDIPSTASTSITHTNTKVNTVTTRSYRAIVYNSAGCNYDSTSIFSVSINPSSVGNVSVNPTTNNTFICNGSTQPYLSISSYSGTVVKWLMNTNNNGWVDFAYSTNSAGVYDYNVNVTGPLNRSYRAVINNTNTCSVDSTNAVTVSLSPIANGNLNTVIPTGVRTVSCYSKAINVSIITPSGYSIIKWIYSNNNGPWTDFTNSTTSSSLTDNNTWVSQTTSRSYRVILSNNTLCKSDTSGTFTVLINARSSNIGNRNLVPTVGSSNICSGATVTLNTSPGGGNELYKWTYSDNGNSGPWFDAYSSYGQLSFTHRLTQVSAITNRLYRAIITDTSTCDFDSTMAVAVQIKPMIYGRDTSLSISGLDTICAGSTIALSVSPGSGNSVVKWLYNINAGSWQTFTNSTNSVSLSDNSTLYIPGTVKGYTTIVLKGATCSNDTLTKFKPVYIKNKTYGTSTSVVATISSTDTVCAGNSVSMYTSGTIERWLYRDGNTSNWQVIPSSSVSSLSHTNTALTTSTWRYYRAIVNTGSCNADSTKMDSVFLRVYTAGNLGIAPTTTTPSVCAGNSLVLSLSISGATIQRWIYRDNSGVWNTFYNGNSTSVSDNNTYLSTITTREYKVILLKNCSYDTTNALVVTISPKTNGTDISKTPTATSINVCAGNPVQNIQVTAGSGNTIMQWLYRDNNGAWNILVNGNSNNVTDYNTYFGQTVTRDYVAIINNNSTCKYDTTAKLTVNINPVVLGNNNNKTPVANTVSCMGSSYTVSMNVSSDTSIIRFMYSTNGGAWTDKGFMNPTTSYSFSEYAYNAQAPYVMGYRAVLYKASTCRIDTTAASFVNIGQRGFGNDNAIIPTGPSSVCGTTSFSTSITPGSGNSIQYWMYSDNNGPWNIYYSTSTSISWSASPSTPTTRSYRAMIVKGNTCSFDTSGILNIALNPVVYGIDTVAKTTVSAPKGICTGSSATISASNFGSSSIYSWLYRNSYNGTWLNFNSSSSSIIDNNTNVAGSINRQYAVLLYKSTLCRMDTTTKNDTAFISPRAIGRDTTITITTASSSICNGNPIQLTASGLGSNTVQQWIASDNGGLSWYNLLYSSSTSLTDYNTTVSTTTVRKYRLIVKKSNICSTDSSAILTVTINLRSNGTDNAIVPTLANANVCSGSTVGISITPGSGNSILRWISSSNNGPWVDFAITSATSINDYNTVTSTVIARKYRAVISKGSGCSIDTSAAVTASINPLGYGNQNTVAPVASKSSVCSGSTVSLSISGFSGSSVRYWLFRDNLTDPWSVINTGSTNITDFNTLTTTLITRQYAVLVVNASGCSFDTTGATTVAINPITNTTISTPVQASELTVCAGNPINVFFNAPSGYTIKQWLFRNIGGEWLYLNGSTAASVNDYNTSVSSSITREYKVLVSNTSGCSIDSSTSVSVNINIITQGSNLSIVPTSPTQTICSGNTAVINVSGFSGSVVQWLYRDSIIYPWSAINSNGFTLYHTSTNVTYSKVRYYRALVYNGNNCSYDTTAEIQITINPQLQGNANSVVPTSTNSAYCSGAVISLNASGFINGGVVTKWIYSDNSGPWNTIPSSGSASISHNNTIVSTKITRAYRALVITGCNTDTTASLDLVIDVYPTKPSVQRNGSSDTLMSSVTAATYQWKLNGSNIPGATNNIFVATQNGNYSVEVGNTSNCKSLSDGFNFVRSGLFEEWLKTEMHIYPNPTQNGMVYTDIEHLSTNSIHVMVYDLVGKLVTEQQLEKTNNHYILNLSNQNAGIYFLTYNILGTTVTQKVVVGN